MKTDEQLKAIAFDKYLAAADSSDKSGSNGLAMMGAAMTLRAAFAVEKALEIDKSRHEVALEIASDPLSLDEMKELMRRAGYKV
jgi:hypothetical protein